MGERFLTDSEKEALLAALEATAGSISAENHPEWATPQKVAAGVRALRPGNPLPNTGVGLEEH